MSNHPSSNWDEAQKAASSRYGETVDLPFPMVDATGDEECIAKMADEYTLKVESLADREGSAVHIMGELTLCFALIRRLQEKGYVCLASTTERIVTETVPGRKESIFKFVRFRQYLQ